MRRARALAAAEIRKAALVKNHPPDLINVALERLLEASLELPAFSTLDELATRIRAEVNTGIFARSRERMGEDGRQRLQALLTAAGPGGTVDVQPAEEAGTARHLVAVQGPVRVPGARWMRWATPSRGWRGSPRARSLISPGRRPPRTSTRCADYHPVKRLALVACLVHTARMRARDDLAEMLCKRVAANVKRAKAELEEIRLRQRAVVGTADRHLPHRAGAPGPRNDEAGGRAGPGQGEARAVAAVEEAGGFAAQLADIEEVSAFHGDNYEVLMAPVLPQGPGGDVRAGRQAGAGGHHERRLGAGLPASTPRRTGPSGATSSRCPRRPTAATTSRASRSPRQNWRRAVTDRRHPGMVARRHFEAMVFTYLAEELRTGDIAVAGAGEYADWRTNLLTWEECEPLLAGFCEKTGLPATAAGFTERLRGTHLDAAAGLDAGYEDNADLVIGEGGIPTLKRRRSAGTPGRGGAAGRGDRPADARAVAAVRSWRAPRYWLGWHHHFGPASGSDPKISDPQGRYCLAVFTGGVNIGPYEAARHIAGVSARELSMVRNRHIDLKKLNAAIAAWSTPSPSWTWSRRGATAPRWPPTAPRWRPTSTTCWPRPRSGTGAWAASPTTTSPTPTSRCSPGSSPAGCGRRCT